MVQPFNRYLALPKCKAKLSKSVYLPQYRCKAKQLLVRRLFVWNSCVGTLKLIFLNIHWF